MASSLFKFLAGGREFKAELKRNKLLKKSKYFHILFYYLAQSLPDRYNRLMVNLSKQTPQTSAQVDPTFSAALLRHIPEFDQSILAAGRLGNVVVSDFAVEFELFSDSSRILVQFIISKEAVKVSVASKGIPTKTFWCFGEQLNAAINVLLLPSLLPRPIRRLTQIH